jgi:ABC-2 type transport system permease protein
MTLRRNLRFIRLLVQMKLARMMAFRFSFFGAFFADGTLFATQVLVFSVIYGQVDSIGGWTRGQMLIFIGTFSMLNGINMVVYFFGLSSVSQKIREGTLDLYITKPGNTLLRLSFEAVNLGSAPLLPLSGAIIAWGVSIEGIIVTPALFLAYSGMVLLMDLLYYDMEVILRTITFFVISAPSIERLEGDMLMLNFQVPGVIFKGFFKVLFYYIMPYGIMATVPTELLSGAYTVPGLLWGIAASIIFTAFTLWFWKLGLRHYKSASS